MNKPIFALDIGTRSVIGLLIEQVDQHYQLIDYYILEHEERAMLDGQIHNVVAVAESIHKVKLYLEEKHQLKLTEACVAAAGRALKTKRVSAHQLIAAQPMIDEEAVVLLELEAVQKAQYELANGEEEERHHYYCVGYSVTYYRLDGEEIGSLIDQQGESAEVEIIATFLPKVVVESLLAALQRAHLDLEALTLEPIAAIQVLIPPSMRRLNVALVDIGAGTSDIAITSEGTVTAYGMVPKAGDEITEAISDHYLLDFHQAEDCKRDITLYKKTIIEDILGFEQEILYEEMVEHILAAVEQLAEAIAQEILALNGGKSPKAVMLVGGGSQTPALPKLLANKLQLPANRVAIRDANAIPSLIKHDTLPTGPDFVTPIGIAIAAKQNPVHYISVEVNGRTIRLFEMKSLTIADSLLAAGINIKKLYGKPGLAAIITYNGKQVTLPGAYGSAPIIYINDTEATIHDTIQNGDTINIHPGDDGSPAKVSIKDLIGDWKALSVYYQGELMEIYPSVTVNEQAVSSSYILQDGDTVKHQQTLTLGSFLHDYQKEINLETPFIIWLNDHQKTMEAYNKTLLINGQPAKQTDILYDEDKIEVISAELPSLKELLEALDIRYRNQIPISYNQQPLTLTKELVKIYRNGERLSLEDHIHPQDNLQMETQKQGAFIFQDIFRFISIDLTTAKGKVELLRNGQPATFFEALQPNDKITIQIENR
ncbi:cell division protein FtsA [Gracilibacillus alcaliphilus]|uniref:cell division protein FtsA n=1 Tax=Gracilibacillus alcaliphilus TaxID=1401441 RepID=UPI00195CB8D4|nr:pilus assembly protein PilM [Gracilibacillus alcaliphilus]MBM7679462.1 cell division protein FtsA [Gracilibacillus alcaliphilus]